jgi:hypothetical protein
MIFWTADLRVTVSTRIVGHDAPFAPVRCDKSRPALRLTTGRVGALGTTKKNPSGDRVPGGALLLGRGSNLLKPSPSRPMLARERPFCRHDPRLWNLKCQSRPAAPCLICALG